MIYLHGDYLTLYDITSVLRNILRVSYPVLPAWSSVLNDNMGEE